MADISDVENALVDAIVASVYPTGIPGNDISLTIGAPARVYRGWPNARALAADLRAGVVNISVYPQAGMTRNTTRFPLDYVDLSVPLPTITVTTFDNTVTFGGAAGAGNLCGIRAGAAAYAYAAAPMDGPDDVAAALAALIPQATVSGATVTCFPAIDLKFPLGTQFNVGASQVGETRVPTPSWNVLGRVVAYGTALQETRRQVQGFLVSCWCPNVALRDTTGSVVDGALAPIQFLPLADGTGGRLLYHNTRLDDAPTKAALWRRDMIYSVEYPTTLTLRAAEMLWGTGTIATQLQIPGNPVVKTITITPE